MDDTVSELKVGLAQIAPVWLDRQSTTIKIVEWIREAASAHCRLVVFGETLLPGYPFWLSSTGGAEFDSKIQKEIHAHYLDQAVCIERGDLDPICDAAQKGFLSVMVGCYERPLDRGGHTGYCSLVTINQQGEIINVHRKLMPTYEERLCWGTGDGAGLKTFNLGPFTVGGLNCWENWMPMARSALYAKGVDLHIAVWPGCTRNTIDITRFIGFESRSYVVSVSGVLRHSDIPDSMPHRDLIIANTPELVTDGGSCVAGPDGKWVLEPLDSKEQLRVVDIDHRFVFEERQNFDPSGHYSRPDVLQLYVNEERQSVIRKN